MTGQGLTGAFGFVRLFAIAVTTLVLADAHPFLVALLVLAFVLLGWIEVSRHRREPRTGSEPSAWWLGILIPFGLGVWATFLYLAMRTRRRRWLAWSFVYLLGIVAGAALNLIGGDEDPVLGGVALFLWLGTWVAGALHAHLVRERVRVELDQPVLQAPARQGR